MAPPAVNAVGRVPGGSARRQAFAENRRNEQCGRRTVLDAAAQAIVKVPGLVEATHGKTKVAFD
jgi:hypothetical protein